MPTPEEMRAKSNTGRVEQQKRTEALRRQIAAERKAKFVAAMDLKDSMIRSVEFAMEQAAKSGYTKVSERVNTRPHWGDREVYEPVLQAVVEHFEAQGFTAKYEFANQTEYYGDGAGPGEDWQIIKVDWSDA